MVKSIRNVVLVHGAWTDGSGWEGVYWQLKEKGFQVSIVQNPLTSFADDVNAARRVLDLCDGPAVLAGHSYGGAVITEAGNHQQAARLVYIAAFALDNGESVGALTKDPQSGVPMPPILPPQDGFLFLDKQKFHATCAADVDPRKAAFMADAMVPLSLAALNGTVGEPAWKAKPSWYLVATEDKMIPPDVQRFMAKRSGATVVEVQGSHAVYVSKPSAVADLIEKAAKDE